MKYLMLGLVGMFMMGCATTQTTKRIERLETVVSGQAEVIELHNNVLMQLIKHLKKLNRYAL